jgi:hypothetical protein
MSDQPPRPDSKPGPPPIAKATSFRLFERGMVDRVIQGVRGAFSPERPSGNQNENEQTWFGPGKSQTPLAPKDEVAGRQFDFPVGINTYSNPRVHEPITFEQLRSLSDPAQGGWDLLRLAIETRKDQLSKLEFSVMPRKRPDESFRRRPDERCREVENFLRKPDRIHYWPQWVRMLCEEELVLGAPAVYGRKDMSGKPWAFEVVSGDKIVPLLDGSGRQPMPPEPAYNHVLKGVVATQYSADELIYFPRNPRAHKIYGMGVVEQIVMIVNIGLRRQAVQLESFTSGNVPDALISTPKEWGTNQIAEYQRYWDSMMETPNARRKAKFIPGDVVYQPTRTEGSGLMDSFDEWLARVVCYAFSLPPLPFVRVMNRATAQTSYETALEEGLAPMMIWLKNAVDDMVGRWFGFDDIELVWDNIRKLDPQDQAGTNLQFMQRGVKSLDEVRAEMGLEPLGLSHVMFGVGPLGFMSIKDMQRCIEMGLTMPPAPMPPEMIDPATGQPIPGAEEMMGQGGMAPGQPPQGPTGQNPLGDMLAGVPPQLLADVGLSADGELADDGEDEPGDELDQDAAHPEVANALRDFEAGLKG